MMPSGQTCSKGIGISIKKYHIHTQDNLVQFPRDSNIITYQHSILLYVFLCLVQGRIQKNSHIVLHQSSDAVHCKYEWATTHSSTLPLESKKKGWRDSIMCRELASYSVNIDLIPVTISGPTNTTRYYAWAHLSKP